MGERFLETNGLNNDDDFPRTIDHGEPRETLTESNEPPRSTRSNPVEAMCKWTGADPSDCAKDMDLINRQLRNRTAPALSTEERLAGSTNGPTTYGTGQILFASWQADDGMATESILQKHRGHESMKEITSWVDYSLPPTLIDEENERTPPPMEDDMMSTLTMGWFTPPNTEEQRQIGRVKSYDSLQSMDYFTARSQHTPDMGKSVASSIDTNELGDQAINEMKGGWLRKFVLPTGWMEFFTRHCSERTESHEKANEYEYENSQTIEARILEALVLQQECENNTELKWWNEDESSYQSYEQEQCELQKMDEYVQEQGRLLELKLVKSRVANEEKKDMHPNEHKQDEHPQKDYNCKPINSFFMPKRALEDRDVREKDINVIETNKNENEKSITAEMLRLIRSVDKHLLTKWKSTTKEYNDCNYFRNNIIARLICSRWYMSQKIGSAIELSVLLRRCSYPKRDVIRWSLD
eukprot:scaffold8716_cov65-Cyclotella_meneghiniana.AAC.5